MIIRVVTPLLLLAAAIFALNQIVLDSERIGRLVADAALEFTGLDVDFGEIEFDLYPAPAVTATNAWVRGSHFVGAIEAVTVRLDPWPLFRREVAIERIEGQSLQLWLPENPVRWVDSIDDIIATVNQRPAGGGAIKVSIADIVTHDARVYIGEDTEPHILLSGNATNVTESNIGIDVRLDFPKYGENASAEGSVTLVNEKDKALRAVGQADLRDVGINRLPMFSLPEGVLNAQATFEETEAGSAVALATDFSSEAYPGLTGNGDHRMTWGDTERFSGEFRWDGVGFHAEALARSLEDGSWHLGAPLVTTDPEALPGILSVFDSPEVRLAARDTASAELRDVDVEISESGNIDLRHGSFAFNGIDVITARRGKAIDNVSGRMTLENNVITVDSVRSEAITLTGTLTPDIDARTLAVDLASEIDLNASKIALATGYEGVSEFRGHLSVEKVGGTFVPGQGIPRDLVVEAWLVADEIVIEDEAMTARIRALDARFDSDVDVIRTTAQLAPTTGGGLTVDGTYTFADGIWNGLISTDVGGLAETTIEASDYREYLMPVAKAYGPSTFEMQVDLPTAERHAISVAVHRQGDIPTDGTATWAACDEGFCLDSATFHSRLASAPILRSYFPSLLGCEGDSEISMAYDGPASRFEIDVALDDSAIDMTRRVAKPRGIPLRGRLTGKTAGGLQAEAVEIQIADAIVPMRLSEMNPRRPFRVDLASLRPLLNEGVSARGIVSGELTLDPLDIETRLADVAVELGEGVGLDRIAGGIRYTQDVMSVDQLLLVGARSDCEFNVVHADGRWDATAKGTRLDLEAMLELQEAVQNLANAWDMDSDDEPEAARSLWDDPIVGQATIAFDAVHYNQGQLQDVTARLIADGKSIRLRDLSVRPGTGAITGTVAIVPADDVDALVRSAFTWNNVDTAALDAFLSPANRGVYGTLNGELLLTAPLGTVPDMLATGTGKLTWTARDGSLGKLGVATKLLTALKTMEIINLRAPSLRDKGLVYYTFDGSVELVNGLATLGPTTLDGGAYKMNPVGTVDFAREATDVTVTVGLLQSVSNVVDRVPIVGGLVTGLTTDNVRVAVKLSGSPYDLQASTLSATGKAIVQTPATIGENVVKGVGRGIKNLVPKRSRERDDTSNAEPR